VIQLERIKQSTTVNTIEELVELLKKYPKETKVVHDYGLALEVDEYEYADGNIAINFF
jgi:hypothetical protein